MTRHLRLHRDPPETDSHDQADVYKFPLRPAARSRLVAGTVANPADPAEADDGVHPDIAGRVVGSEVLVRQIEETLDRMQRRLDRFRSDMGGCFKFPRPSDDGPRAA